MNEEEKKELLNKVEAILFSAGRSIPINEIATICSTNPTIIKEAAQELKKNMDDRNSPLLVIEETDAWKMTVRENYLDLVRDITPHTELDKATLETLAVIAWKQPVLQSDVIKIRTSSAYEHVSGLVDMGFISKEKKGRSYVLKTTGQFFDYFDLPGKEALKEKLKELEDGLQAQAEKEGMTGDNLGTLEVYQTEKEEPQEQKELGSEPDKLGKLEVYEKTEQEERVEEIEMEASEEKEEELPEESDEEKTKRMIEELEEPEEAETHEPIEEKSLHPALEKFIEDEDQLGSEKKTEEKTTEKSSEESTQEEQSEETSESADEEKE